MSGSVIPDWVLEARIAKNRVFLFALTLGWAQLIPCIKKMHFSQADVWIPSLLKRTQNICAKFMSSYVTTFMVTNIHARWRYQGIHSSHLISTCCDRFGRINTDLKIYNFYGNTPKNHSSILLSILKNKFGLEACSCQRLTESITI